MTADEADRLSRLYDTLDEPAGMLIILDDPHRPEWRIMRGPCAFRQVGNAGGGCRIYEERPGSCIVFTCSFLLRLRREKALSG